MEKMVSCFSGIYSGKKVVVTGHTGFKGSWLCLWLKALGAEPVGIALNPEGINNHWDQLSLDIESHIIDVNNSHDIQRVITNCSPEIVFHLAAQPLVRRSYEDPVLTWKTNVIGTANVLSACIGTPSVKAVVAITTDKVYQNQEWIWGYRELDALGGNDPYSASKAAAELLISSYRKSFLKDDRILLASARAGNVIGGGDWSLDRLIPDLVRAVQKNESLEIRYPTATRPWQHVLDCLSGYLLLGQLLLEQRKVFADAWNFGPDKDGNRSVEDVLSLMKRYWAEVSWYTSAENHPHEAKLLYLDSCKARDSLNWKPVLTFDEAAAWTVEWYQEFVANGGCKSLAQLMTYIELAKDLKLQWASSL